jgi:hypothetical protein
MASRSHPFSKYISGSKKQVAIENPAGSFLFIAILWRCKKRGNSREKIRGLSQLDKAFNLDATFLSPSHAMKNMSVKTSGIQWLPFHI